MAKRNFIKESSMSDEQLQKTATFLYERSKQDERDRTYASVKHILTYLGIGATIATILVAPNTAGALTKMFFSPSFSYDHEGWKRYNKGYLRQSLRRLEMQKLVKRSIVDGQDVVTITKEGKTKILKYAIEHMEVKKPKGWDGKWRVVIYDIPARDRSIQWGIRDALKAMGFYQMQESVYLFPYSCYDEVEFLRSFYGIDAMVKYLLVTKLEDDTLYREYFGV
ncbi:hypothetical protein HY409_03090 [Candidatus Gottesmanbacteria bacterium]|nr:hypothetical protein [Candidatus Gottesmanbacteria bacterium]